MADFSKISPDKGATMIYVKDRNSVHWDQAKGYVGRNLHQFPYWVTATITKSGITQKINSDGSIHISGTATGFADFVTHTRFITDPNPMYLPYGKYRFTVNSNKVNIYIGTTYNGAYYQIAGHDDHPTYVDFTIDENTNSDYKLSDGSVLVSPHIAVEKGVTIDDTIYPIITYQDTPDKSWEPYLKTSEEIIDIINDKDIVFKTKNLIMPTSTIVMPDSLHGLTFTYNDDDSITIKGTSTAQAWIYYDLDMSDIPNDIWLRLSGMPVTSSNDNYLAYIEDRTTNKNICYDTGSGEYFKNNGNTLRYVINIKNGITLPTDGITVYPMITLASVTDTTYSIPRGAYRFRGNVQVYRRYNMCILNIVGDSIADSDGKTLATLPKPYRPYGFNCNLYSKVYNGSDFVDAQINVNMATGVVSLETLFGKAIENAQPSFFRGKPSYVCNV